MTTVNAPKRRIYYAEPSRPEWGGAGLVPTAHDYRMFGGTLDVFGARVSEIVDRSPTAILCAK
jgi:hypothetical protein